MQRNNTFPLTKSTLEGEILISGVRASSFMEQLSEQIAEKLFLKLQNSSVAPETSKTMSVAEVAKYFGVTTTTVHSWGNRGWLQKRKIGARVFFIESEVKSAAKSLAKYKHQ